MDVIGYMVVMVLGVAMYLEVAWNIFQSFKEECWGVFFTSIVKNIINIMFVITLWEFLKG